MQYADEVQPLNSVRWQHYYLLILFYLMPDLISSQFDRNKMCPGAVYITWREALNPFLVFVFLYFMLVINIDYSQKPIKPGSFVTLNTS